MGGASSRYQVSYDLVVSWNSNDVATFYARPQSYLHRCSKRYTEEREMVGRFLQAIHTREVISRMIKENEDSSDDEHEEAVEIGQRLPPKEKGAEETASYANQKHAPTASIKIVWPEILQHVEPEWMRSTLETIFREQDVREVKEAEFNNVVRSLWVMVSFGDVVRALTSLSAQSSLDLAYESLNRMLDSIDQTIPEEEQCDLIECARRVAEERHGKPCVDRWPLLSGKPREKRPIPKYSNSGIFSRTIANIYAESIEDTMKLIETSHEMSDPTIANMPLFVDALLPYVLKHNGSTVSHSMNDVPVLVNNGIVETSSWENGEFVTLRIPAEQFRAARSAAERMQPQKK